MARKEELKFYGDAFRANGSRVERGYGWPYGPSPTVIRFMTLYDLQKDKDMRVLDVGCGDGRHLDLMISLGIENIFGVDFCQEAIDHCKRRFEEEKKQPELYVIDTTVRGAFESLGGFDLIIDWSVMGHIRREYLQNYLRNVMEAIKQGGYLISVQIARDSPGLMLGKRDWKITSRGHYSRGYTLRGLEQALSPLTLTESREKADEGDANGNLFNAVMMMKV